MTRLATLALLMALAGCTPSAPRATDTAAAPPAANMAAAHPDHEQALDWLQMIPPDELKALENGDVPDVSHDGDGAMPQFGTFRTVDSVVDRPVRLPGYVVPLENDVDGRLTEFLFVPYYGACVHVPPPPPNQIVHVRLAKAIAMPDMYSPFFLTGTLVAEQLSSTLAGTAYTMRNAGLRPYEE